MGKKRKGMLPLENGQGNTGKYWNEGTQHYMPPVTDAFSGGAGQKGGAAKRIRE